MKKYLIAILCIALILSACKNARFNSEDWKANKNREEQINSLIRSKVLIGKSYADVIQLLGKEDLNFAKLDSLSNKTFRIEYLTGGGQMIDFERLKIVFDSSKVIEVEKYYD